MEDRPPGIPELRPVPAPIAVRVLIPPHALLTHRVALYVGLIRTQRTPAPPAIPRIIQPMYRGILVAITPDLVIQELGDLTSIEFSG